LLAHWTRRGVPFACAPRCGERSPAPDCPYDLIAPIGWGGCAVVYSAIRRNNPLVAAAVKVQKPSVLGFERFRREIDIHSRLDHPHVMPLIEASARGDWYAMPLADYTLRGLHAQNPFDWESLRIALSGVCGALLHAHAHNVVHRDATPDNILALPGPHWVLSDFGLARICRASRQITRGSAMFGTPQFAAPEVHHDPRTVTGAADAYSLGAIASWFTNISSDQEVSSESGRYWSTLIRSTKVFYPEARWSVAQIAHYLESAPARARVRVLTRSSLPCARCQAYAGVDGAGRCTRCGFMDEL
jgi:serine/threonine protein kinase